MSVQDNGHRGRDITKHEPDDPEQEFSVEIIVSVKGFGRSQHRYSVVEGVARAVSTSVSDSAKFYWDGKRYVFNPRRGGHMEVDRASS